MCRGPDCPSGRRRCHEPAEKRRARHRASYAAAKLADGNAVNTAMGRPRIPDSPPELTDPAAPAPGTKEAVTAAIAEAQDALAVTEDRPAPHYPEELGIVVSGDSMTDIGDDGWPVATEAGKRVDVAVRTAGAAVAARAEALAAEDLENIGRSPALREVRPEGFADRDEYVHHIEAQLESIEVALREVREKERAASAAYRLGREKRRKDGLSEHDVKAKTEIQAMSRDILAKHDAYVQANRDVAAVHTGTDAWSMEASRIRSEAYLATLKEQRDFGPREDLEVNYAPRVTRKAKAKLEAAMAYYPTDWTNGEEGYVAKWTSSRGTYLEAEHQEVLPLMVSETSGRASYGIARRQRSANRMILVSKLTISSDHESCLEPGVTTAIHEYGHRMERMHPQVNQIMQTHLAIRTTGDDGRRDSMQPYMPSSSTRKTPPGDTMEDWVRRQRDSKTGEWTRPDHFAEVYTGKQYDGDSSEVLTTGMEGVFAGRFGGLSGQGAWREDTAHRDLILGTLATVGRKA